MADNCTIYCGRKDLADVHRLLQTDFTDLDSAGPVDEWTSLTVQGNVGSLRLTSKIFRERGDEFCRLLLSTSTFIEKHSRGNAEVKQSLSKRVLRCQLAIGVVIEPDVEADERYNSVVFEIAKALDGVIFNGREFIDATGDVLVEKAA